MGSRGSGEGGDGRTPTRDPVAVPQGGVPEWGEKAGASLFIHSAPAGGIEDSSGSSQVGGVPSTRTLVSSHPPLYSRGVARPSITLRSASASSDSLRLRSPSWTTAERRAACKVRRPWDKGWKAAARWSGRRARGKPAQRDGARAVDRALKSAKVQVQSAPSYQV